MTRLADVEQSQQVGIIAPIGKDASLTAAMLKDAGIAAVIYDELSKIDEIVREGVGALLLTEEALDKRKLTSISTVVAQQPPWSDLPILLLARTGANSSTVFDALQVLGNVTLIERPVRVPTLISTVRAALKARLRQYQVREHLAERARSEQALREADRRKDEFLATLAHELRNPLAPLRNALHILRLTGVTDPGTEQVCELMERQVNHLVRLVDDLLEVSRITRGKVELRTEPVELAAVLRNAVESSRPVIEASGHQLAISMPSESLVLNGDPVRLSQVFSNLLNNAAKYMNDGGQIWLTARREGGQTVISVRDTGVGIAPDMLPHVFEMFTQIDRSKRQAQGGLGIGLTLVRALTDLHGGTVEARSAGVDRGSEFTVRLPLSTVGALLRSRGEEPPLTSLPKQRVLVVDDNHDGASSLCKLLEILGLQARTANDGPTALDMLEWYRPGVILLDIGMPGMDGYEVARRIRDRPEGGGILLIALTGWGQEEDRQRTRSAGFDHHLLKPANLDALKSILLSLDA